MELMEFINYNIRYNSYFEYNGDYVTYNDQSSEHLGIYCTLLL
jgi:hypothetical protein